MGPYKNQEKIDECMQLNILFRREREPEKNDDITEKKVDKSSKPVRKTTFLESNFDVQLLRVLIEM
jgi:dynein heavy chain